MSNLRIVSKNGRKVLATRNLAPGKHVYGEDFMIFDDVEYRAWDPYRSKLAAAILKGLSPTVVEEGQHVLYLGTSTGTTASHVSDLIGGKGLLMGVEFSPRVAREFIERVAKPRANVIPCVADARDPSNYPQIGKVDVIYCDIAQPDQTQIAIANCASYLKQGGRLLLVVKSRSIDVLKEPKEIFEREAEKLQQAGYVVANIIDLRPYDKDHALIEAVLD